MIYVLSKNDRIIVTQNSLVTFYNTLDPKNFAAPTRRFFDNDIYEHYFPADTVFTVNWITNKTPYPITNGCSLTIIECPDKQLVGSWINVYLSDLHKINGEVEQPEKFEWVKVYNRYGNQERSVYVSSKAGIICSILHDSYYQWVLDYYNPAAQHILDPKLYTVLKLKVNIRNAYSKGRRWEP